MVGLGNGEHARPRHRAPARAALRAARRDRHRLHDPVSVDDARVPRGRRRRAHRPPVPRGEPRAREPVRAVRDRTTVGALVPMLDPKLAVDELEYAVRELGFKTAVFAGHARRAVGTRTRTASTRSASTAPSTTTRCGPSASSSASRPCSTARCRGTASLVRPRATCTTTSAASPPATSRCASRCSSPASRIASRRLRFGFLEGGVAWACSLLGDLVGHWEKRNASAIRALDPDVLDVDALLALFEQYGDDRVRAGLTELRAYFTPPERAARAARRVRGGRARVGRGPARPVRAELLLRLRGRRPAGRVGVRRDT